MEAMRLFIKRALLVSLLLVSVATRARAQDYQEGYAPPPEQMQYGYVGLHPVPYDQGSGICYEAAAHFHPSPPFDQYLFRQANGYFYFVGDIGDFGYTGQLWAYQGNHPIPGELGGGYCYI